MKLEQIVFLFIFLLINSLIKADEIESSVSYVCSLLQNKNQNQLAVFPFTNLNGETDKESLKIYQKFLTKLSSCKDLEIIDKGKVQKVLEEQTNIQSGMYTGIDDIKMGQIMGAKNLLYGTYENNFLQISVIDAESGKVVGAYAEDKTQKKEISSQIAEKNHKEIHLRRFLNFLYNQRPVLFIYVVSTDEELEQEKNFHPIRYKRFIQRVEEIQSNLREDQKKNLEEVRKVIQEIRKKNLKENEILLKRRKEIIDRINRK